MKVGVCGTGRMGAAIAQRLIAVGHEVGVWNRDAATEAVYRGTNGLLTAKLAGKLVIDMSTIRPDTMTSVGDAVTKLSAGFVECPVGGSTGHEKEGKLFGFVGG